MSVKFATFAICLGVKFPNVPYYRRIEFELVECIHVFVFAVVYVCVHKIDQNTQFFVVAAVLVVAFHDKLC